MRKNRKIIAWLLVLSCLLELAACGKNDPESNETSEPIQTTTPAETETTEAVVMEDIRQTKELDVQFGRYYEMVYTFASNVARRVRFVNDGVACYKTNEYEVAEGENEITVRFAAGKAGAASLELGGLGAFKLTFTGLGIQEVS